MKSLSQILVLLIVCSFHHFGTFTQASSSPLKNFLKRRSLHTLPMLMDTVAPSAVTLSAEILHHEPVVDYSVEGIVRRLAIYIKANDPGAVFCELKGNHLAASLEVFNRLIGMLWEISQLAPEDKIFSNSKAITQTPVGLVSAIILAFINFHVNVVEAAAFKDFTFLFQFVEMLQTAHRPVLPFFVLLHSDLSPLAEISKLPDHGPVHLYALHRAIMLLPNPGMQISTLSSILRHFDNSLLKESKVFFKIFRESLNVDLCRFILNSGLLGSDVHLHPSLYSRSRTPRNHPKWELYEEIFGSSTIQAFLENSSDIRPQKMKKRADTVLPFIKCPLPDQNHPRWKLYELAYGPDLVQSHKLAVMDIS